MPTWDQPYVSYRSPVCAANVVATSQPLAVQAGLDAMRRGGNAVDAALATAITLTVVEPNNNGIGSDAFAIAWDGNELTGLNASGRAPAGWCSDRFAGHRQMPLLGWDSVTVPGAVSAWVSLSEKYGKMPFPDLFDAAIHYAESGFQVGPKTAYYWQRAAESYASFDEFCRHFLPAPEAGEVVYRPDLADTLSSIASTMGKSFYTGELADRMVAASTKDGGILSREDLEQHEATWVEPLAVHYRNIQLHEIPPNGQGLAAQIALGILNYFDPPPLDSADSVHLQLECMKIAIRAAFEHFADDEYMNINPQELLDPGMLQSAAGTIGSMASPVPPITLPVGQDTVYLTTADASGMMVSFIQSNYHGFGSGIVIPDTGIAMQNRGCGFSLDPNHPNCVAPGKRPFHTIIPGFVTEGGAPRLSFGVMGGHMQHQGHMQMVQRIFDHRQNPQAASDAPRWHIKPDFSVALETGFSTGIANDLAERGHRIEFESTTSVFGGAQLIYRAGDGYIAGSDHRKEGMAAGF